MSREILRTTIRSSTIWHPLKADTPFSRERERKERKKERTVRCIHVMHWERGIEETFQNNANKPTYKSRLRNQTKGMCTDEGRYMISKIGVIRGVKEWRREMSCALRLRVECPHIGRRVLLIWLIHVWLI